MKLIEKTLSIFLKINFILSRACIWILILLTQVCYGQADSSSLYFDHLSINNGLSHNTIFSLLQDQHGYIWIGTQNGLNKYDGYSFEVYQSNKTGTGQGGFKGKHISALFEDRSDNLWVGTRKNGINFKSKASDKFLNLQTDSAFASIQGAEISSFYEDHASNIWITTVGAGVLKYHPATQEAIVFNTKNSSISSDIVFDMLQDKYGVIWVATAGGGLNYISSAQLEMRHLTLPNSPNMNGFRKTLLLDGEDLWVGTQGTGLYKMDLRDKSFVLFTKDDAERKINSNAVIDLFKTADGRLFIATDGNGLNVYNTHTERMSSYQYQAYEQAALNSNALLCFLGDRTGNIWIGTFNGGVNIYKPNKTWFDFYTPKATNKNDLPVQSILSIVERQNGQVLVGTDGGGLGWVNNGNLEASRFIHDPANSGSIAANEVKTVFEDSEGQLWVGLFAGGLDLYNPDTKSFRHFFDWHPNVWSITEIKKTGKLLVGTLGDGLFTVDIHTKETERFLPKSKVLNSLTDNNITTVFVDNVDRIWIGSIDKGLDVMDESEGIYYHFKFNPNDSSSISNNEIRTIFQDSDGDIWIGTEGGGLNRWLGEERFDKIKAADGLIADNVMGITQDITGFIWVSTFQGVSRIDKKSKNIKNFNFRSFQSTNQFNQSAILTDREGNIFFGGINGLHAIHPKNVIEDNLVSELIFTDLKIYGNSITVGELENGRTILNEPIEHSSDIWLSHLDQSFTIYFNAIDYTDPLENEYAFKLEGFNDDWEYIQGGKPSATYTNLDPGSYIFRIKHKGRNETITIHIEPPFWQRTWFRVLVLIIFSVVSFSILKFWIQRREASANRKILQLQNEKLETEVDAKNSKLMFSSVQMAHKNEVLTELKENLIEYEKSPEGNFRSLIRKVEYELKNENYWNEFNLYLNEVDHNFLDKMTKKHPKLTKNDLRMCSLLRMNLSTKEIASLLNISVRAVEQSRYRLKKRFNLEPDDDLTKYISSFYQ